MSRPDDLHDLEVSLLDGIAALSSADGRGWPEGPLDVDATRSLFTAQVRSRVLDHTARWLRALGHGYYTIGSAGHEGNGAVALALRVTDPALLHYRSGGFYLARAAQAEAQGTGASSEAVDDVLRGMLASTTERIAGGRHKVWGNVDLNVIPQTSTIGSHPPRAVGLAASFGHVEAGAAYPSDAVVVCSFGDASLNHSTTQGAVNWACHAAHHGRPVPVLFVCEDNGLGISVPTPRTWVAAVVEGRGDLRYADADGSDPAAVARTTAELADHVRRTRQPAFLHLRTVRYLGHAGADAEIAYRTPSEIRADHARDPLLGTARLLVAAGGFDPAELVAAYLSEREAIRARALELAEREPAFRTAAEVMEPLAPRRPDAIARRAADLRARGAAHGHRVAGAAADGRLTLAQTINEALAGLLAAQPDALVFGEDVGRKGGVYGVTRGLQRTFSERQVFDTLLDETSILGLALGSALNGALPIPEIQYLAYLHNAGDQLRGEAATLSFFSQGQYRNGMVVRIAAYAYQAGFGGHFHNDNSVAALRDIPGLVIASPSHPADAGPMLRTCAAAALEDGTVSAFLEPIARYHTTDLHTEGDGVWLAAPTDEHVPIGSARTHGDGSDLTIVTWGNGAWLSRRARHRLGEAGVEVRVLDLRWLAPLPVDDLLREARATGRVLIADETRRTGGVGEGVVAALVDGGFDGTIVRVAGVDSFIPLGEAAHLVLISEDDIVTAAQKLVAGG